MVAEKEASYTGKNMLCMAADREATYTRKEMHCMAAEKEATYTGKEMPYMAVDKDATYTGKECLIVWQQTRKPLTLGKRCLYGNRQGSHLHWEGDALYGQTRKPLTLGMGMPYMRVDKEAT